jgi:hypothetical protein
MDDDLGAFTLDDVLANGGLADAPPARTPTELWSSVVFGPDADEIRRTELQAKALSSGRIHRWTAMKARDLWREFVSRFAGDEDLALECAIHSAERVVRSKRPESQERLYQLKRRLLGYHARGMLDERHERRGIDAVWTTKPWELPDEDEYRLWPVPWKGLITVIKHVVVKRRGVRPSDL